MTLNEYDDWYRKRFVTRMWRLKWLVLGPILVGVGAYLIWDSLAILVGAGITTVWAIFVSVILADPCPCGTQHTCQDCPKRLLSYSDRHYR